MKNLLKTIFENLRIPIDLMLSVLIIPAAYLLLVFRRVGAKRLPNTSTRLKKIGVFPIRDHYYEPMFNENSLLRSLEEDRHLPGLDLNDEGQLKLLNQLNYREELIALDLNKKTSSLSSFYLENGWFGAGDAEFLYQIIRHLKPRKIIEIGSGNSTKIARLAVNRNTAETGQTTKHICIEPYEQPWLKDLPDITLIRERIEMVDFDWSNELGDGDLLFVDSSHIIRPQGDVLTEYLQIFPQLQKGVYVHIHDIFTPKDYLKSWVIDDVHFWNEQYLLEALLTNTSKYKVVAALNYLKHHHYSQLLEVCPYLTSNIEPGSFYFRVQN